MFVFMVWYYIHRSESRPQAASLHAWIRWGFIQCQTVVRWPCEKWVGNRSGLLFKSAERLVTILRRLCLKQHFCFCIVEEQLKHRLYIVTLSCLHHSKKFQRVWSFYSSRDFFLNMQAVGCMIIHYTNSDTLFFKKAYSPITAKRNGSMQLQ